MQRRRLLPLLILLVASLATVAWLVSRPDDVVPEGAEIARDGGVDVDDPVLRGTPDARRPEAGSLPSDAEAVKRMPGPVSGTFRGPPPRGTPAPRAVEPFRITGTSRDPNTGDVHLLVVDEDGNPREGVSARVSAKGEDGQFSITHEATLDGTGRTGFESVRPGTAYLWLRLGNSSYHLRIRVEAGKTTEAKGTMPVGVVVEGTVRHVSKGPLAGIQVQVERGSFGFDATFRATSDTEGHYRLEGVPKGTHEVSLKGRAIGYHPRPKAEIVVTGDEDPFEHDFVLGRVGVQGTVRDADGYRPLVGARVEVAGLFADAMTDAAGHYEIQDVPPGTYRVYVTKDGYASGCSGDVQVREDAPAVVDLELSTAAALVFHLRTAEATPVPGVAWASLRVAKGAAGKTTSARITADENGVGRYERIVPGTYVATFKMEGYTAEEQRFVVGPGETVVEVVLHAKTAEGPPALRGVVRDRAAREPLGGVRVSSQRGGLDPAITNAAGEYAFQRLQPGSHKLVVTKDGYGILFLRGVEVMEGEESVRDIDLDAATTLHLHLTDASGDPVVGDVVLSIHPKRGTQGTRVGTSVTTDATGHAVYRRIVPGSYSFALISEAKGRGEVDAEVPPAGATVYVTLR